jgi:hypothetical protein
VVAQSDSLSATAGLCGEDVKKSSCYADHSRNEVKISVGKKYAKLSDRSECKWSEAARG